jgi:RNA polymerase sigma factor (sigma-70 family)
MLVRSDFPNHSDATPGTSFSDETLWSSFKTGNALALSVLYKKHVQPLYSYGMHTCRNHDMVTDCLQELFLRLWKNRDALADVKAAKSYLFKSFRRILIHQVAISRKEAAATVGDPEAFEFLPSVETTIIDAEAREEMLQRLRRCIASLTKGQREIVYLKFFQGLSYQEVADVTEIQIDSVYNLVSKTIDLLRKKMQVTKPLVPLR